MAERLRIFDPAVDQIVDMTEYHLKNLLAIVMAYDSVCQGRESLETIDKRLKAEFVEIRRRFQKD